jgi:hypothetical protein
VSAYDDDPRLLVEATFRELLPLAPEGDRDAIERAIREAGMKALRPGKPIDVEGFIRSEFWKLKALLPPEAILQDDNPPAVDIRAMAVRQSRTLARLLRWFRQGRP